MSRIKPMVAPMCGCCATPTALLPRSDLGEGLAVCAVTGQCYRPGEGGYLPVARPSLADEAQRPPQVRIDLSRSGYA